MSKIEKQRDGLYRFDAGHGASGRIGDGSPGVCRPLASLSKWGRCAMDIAPENVTPDVGAEVLRTVRDRHGVDREALEIQAVRHGQDGKRRGEVHRLAAGSLAWDIAWQGKNDVPADRRVTFLFSHPAGLTWHYQPAPTPHEQSIGATRPDSLIGGWVGYWYESGRWTDQAGQVVRDTQCGRFVELERPLLVDALGNTRPATVTITPVSPVLDLVEIHMDDAWINDLGPSNYPLTLDPDYGTTGVGGSTTASAENYDAGFGPHTVTDNARIDSVSLWTGSAVAITLGMYSDDGHLLGDCAAVTSTNAGWTTCNLLYPAYRASGGTVRTGKNSSASVNVKYDATAGYTWRYKVASYVANYLGNNLGSTEFANYRVSAYVSGTIVYTTAGGSSARIIGAKGWR